MHEIELKFKVDNREALINKLESLGCKIGDIITQNDTVYVENLNNVESIEGSIWLRVRKEDNETSLNLKKQSSKLEDSEEIEFTVSSYEKANHFLETLGYKKWVVVNKKRRYSKYQEFNLCLDEVEKLGSFIEIELLVSDNGDEDYTNKILEVAKLLGLDEKDIVHSHYDTMLSELE